MHKRLVFWYLAAAAGAAATIFGLPHLILHRDPYFPVRTAWCVAALVCQLGAAWYFATNLSGFKRDLRVAYILIAVGSLFLGLAQLQLPLLTVIDAWASWYARGGLVLIPYLITALAMYLGMRKFAQTLGLKLIWAKPWLVVALSAAAIVGCAILFWPYVANFIDHAYDALIGWNEAMGLATVMITYRLRANLGPAYRPAMTWLLVSFTITMVAGLQQLWLLHFTPGAWSYRNHGWSYWLLVAASMAFLRTGLVFRELTRGFSATANPLDVVVYTAGLVSRPRDIEPILNRLRVVTAGMAGKDATEHALTAEQTSKLLQIYIDLEEYLVTKEPLRKLTRDRLRLSLPDSFIKHLPEDAQS
ncbi:MAG TPA: hypothetical protein VHQ86_01680 [Candidatus Saccharimonadia bacterium]|jgi:hypothetical protein|nr:hypothetical protein [Candidatus Saccharimonadia bacterium]